MAQERNIYKDAQGAPPEPGKKDAGKRPAGRPVKVFGYAGYKQDERPRAFELDGRRFTVLSIKKTWQEEAEKGRRRKTVFRVHAHDGRTYDLVRDATSGDWTLEPGGKRSLG